MHVSMHVFQAAEKLNKLLGAIPENLRWLFDAGYTGYTAARGFDKRRKPNKQAVALTTENDSQHFFTRSP